MGGNASTRRVLLAVALVLVDGGTGCAFAGSPTISKGHAVSPTAAPQEAVDLGLDQRGVVLDLSYYPRFNPSAAAVSEGERRAIEAIVRACDLRVNIEREEYRIEGDWLTGTVAAATARPIPIVLLPDPAELAVLLGSAQLQPAAGFYAIPDMAGRSTGCGAAGAYFRREDAPAGAPTARVPRPSNVPFAAFDDVRAAQLSGRVIASLGRTQDELYPVPDLPATDPTNRVRPRPLGTVRVQAYTDLIYSIEIKDAKEKEVGSPTWAFPIMDGNGRPREATKDTRMKERPTPFTNLVHTTLATPVWPGQQVPFVVPHPYLEDFTRLPVESAKARNCFFGTEDVVLTAGMLDAAHGAIAVRKDESWQPFAEDVIIDADPAKHTGLRAIYISRKIESGALIDTMLRLAGKPDLSPAQRSELIRVVERERTVRTGTTDSRPQP